MIKPSAPDSATEITILDFWADWCGICRLIDPVVDRIVRGQDRIALKKVNVAEAQDLVDLHKVSALPTLVFLSGDGRELNRLSGSMTGKQIEAAIGSAISKLS